MHLINEYRILMAVIKANLFNIKTPINVMWRITNKCDSRCKYCNIPLRKQRELSTRQILNLISQMQEAGTQRIGFVGGEPLCRDDIGLIIDKCHKLGIYTTMVSNGTFVQKKIKEIRKLDFLVVSLDGSKEIHEKNRKKGSYENVIKAIRTATKYMPVMTNTVLNKDNSHSVDHVLKLSKKLGFCTHFNVIQGANSHLPDDKYKLVLKKLKAKKRQGYPIVMSDKLIKYYLSWPDFRMPVTKTRLKSAPRCWAGKLFCNVDTDGSIGHCDLQRNTGFNVLEVGFKKAFNTLPRINCQGCTCANLVDYNYMFSMHWDVIYDWFKMVHQGKRSLKPIIKVD